MKTKLIILLIVGLSTVVRAKLIDLTPGGFNPDQGLPPAYFLLGEQIFFDEAAHGWFDLPGGRTYLNQWVSLYGELNGGTYFFTNLFDLGDTPSASIWWDFRGTIYGLTMLNVFGRKPDGTPWEHIYGVRHSKRQRSHPVMVTLDGMTIINSIAFYGADDQGRGPRRPAMLLRDLEKH